jgi:hypothetical protein
MLGVFRLTLVFLTAFVYYFCAMFRRCGQTVVCVTVDLFRIVIYELLLYFSHLHYVVVDVEGFDIVCWAECYFCVCIFE